ncbi:MAG TPA: DEAD/DEAH box helicase [Candidatus Saccharimonadia bacterium]|nr:DEAD/DEAH box helicase [Candidatus Saccharimonadia bacterium]
MSTLKAAIVQAINKLDDPHTIYVLKGFNYWLEDIADHFLFTKQPIMDARPDLSAIASKLSSGGPLFALHEDIAWLNDNSLGGLPLMQGYKIVIVENDLYYIYYPHTRLTHEGLELQELYTKDTDNIIQKYYGDVTELEGVLYIAYNDLTNIQYSELKLSELVKGIRLETPGQAIEIPEEYDAVTFSSLVTQVIEMGASKVSILVDKLASDRNVQNIKTTLEPLGIIFATRDYEIARDTIDSDKLAAYREILQRKNSSYDFKDIQVYSDPYEGTAVTSVNQARIINDVVENAIKSQHNEPFRDVFTTAPTGAGKSVMFQVPAIYLAEKYDLLTIVVSPLIGLMNDQVDNVKTMTKQAATINSDYTPIEKENTMDRVKSGEVSILYLSPESLLSNSDITNLIGDRKIGLVVVDEAHIVATWGKSFRPDYWYLGEFIHRLRNDPKTEHRFPIVTFTATATFGGNDNMYQEIIESLKMTPLKYIGNVKRNDITFDIRKHIKDHAYKEEKLQTAVAAINEMAERDEKTLVYVPYTRHIADLYAKMNRPEQVGRYAGNMTPGEKNETLKSIKNGSKHVVLATKAFGMGIDIDDIKNVYHFAPTGNVADYVQEIGRAARRSDMTGVASTDFFKEDFRYIKQLHGMSSIKNYQAKAVLQKIYELYTKYNKRNFLVSPDEFSYIFADQRPDEVDAKLKTTLLILKKDFELDPNLNYVPLVFKPRSMFTYGYFMINDDFVAQLERHKLLKFFKKMELPRVTEEMDPKGSIIITRSPGDTYQLDFKALWEKNYREMSFGMFKRCFYMGELEGFDFKIGEKIINRIVLEIDGGNRFFGEVKSDLIAFLDAMKEIFDDLKQSGKHFSTEDLTEHIINKHGVHKKHIADMVAASFMHLLTRVDLGNSFFASNFFEYNSVTNKYALKNTTYERRLYALKKTVRIMLADDTKTKTVRYATKVANSKEIIIGQLMELLEVAECKISSGSNPEFFVRVNNPYAIEKIISNPSYVSRTVALVGEKHKESYELMGYFFEKLNTDDERWGFIERYFLGQLGDIE